MSGSRLLIATRSTSVNVVLVERASYVLLPDDLARSRTALLAKARFSIVSRPSITEEVPQPSSQCSALDDRKQNHMAITTHQVVGVEDDR